MAEAPAAPAAPAARRPGLELLLLAVVCAAGLVLVALHRWVVQQEAAGSGAAVERRTFTANSSSIPRNGPGAERVTGSDAERNISSSAAAAAAVSTFSPCGSPGPVVLFTMQRDEEALLEPWLRYHSWLFGPENMHVLDDCSQKRSVLEVLRTYEELGVHVLRSDRCDKRHAKAGWFLRKAEILSRVMNMHKEPCATAPSPSMTAARTRGAAQPQAVAGGSRLLWPLDVDEFVASMATPMRRKDPEQLSTDPVRIRSALEEAQRIIQAAGTGPDTHEAKRFKVWTENAIGCCPGSLDEYLAADGIGPQDCDATTQPAMATRFLSATMGPAAKTLFRADTFVATDAGNHWGEVQNDKSGGQLRNNFRPHNTVSKLVLLHFRAMSFNDWVTYNAQNAKAANVDKTNTCPPRSRGRHYCVAQRQISAWRRAATGEERRDRLRELYARFMTDRCKHIMTDARIRLRALEEEGKLAGDTGSVRRTSSTELDTLHLLSGLNPLAKIVAGTTSWSGLRDRLQQISIQTLQQNT